MSWVTFSWALSVGACAVMALPHLLIGLTRRAWENLFFAIAALAVAGTAVGELGIMHSQTTVEIGRAIQLAHIPICFIYVGVVGFIRSYFGCGRLWLGIAVYAVRALMLVINFTFPPNVNFREITSLRRFEFLGETISMPAGVLGPGTALGLFSSLLMLVFVIDASFTLWRRGSAEGRHRAVVIGGSVSVFILIAAGWSALANAQLVQSPHFVSFPFLFVVLAMGFELSYDLVRAAQTERRLRISDGALRESEVRMSLAANAGNLGLWTWDIPRDDIWLSDTGRALFGFAHSKTINFSSFLETVHPDDREGMRERIQSALSGQDEYESEYRIAGPNGEIRWVAGYGRVEFDQQGKAIVMRGVTRDITFRKQTEKSLRESEARLSAAIEVAALGLYELRAGADAYVDERTRVILGIPQHQDSRALDFWAEHVHPDDKDRVVELQRQLSEGEIEEAEVEYRFVHPERGLVWLREVAHVMEHDSNRQAVLQIGVFQDITESKQAELDHQLQSMELARVGRVALMGELAASLAHEVNNPLGAIVTNASAGQRLLSHGQLQTDELRELLADIVADGHRAREVVQGIRNMVWKSQASYALVDLKEIIRDLLRIVRADAIARKVSLVPEVDPNPGIVLADRVQLLQVLLNLTINAFEALAVMRPEARRVVIRADCVQDGKICVSVRDTGPGFPSGMADQLFEPFFSTKTEGTGMGLPIARSIIEAHGGTLSAENGAQGGARFIICLPEAAVVKSQAA